jgi:hypothetical protein
VNARVNLYQQHGGAASKHRYHDGGVSGAPLPRLRDFGLISFSLILDPVLARMAGSGKIGWEAAGPAGEAQASSKPWAAI